MISKLETKDLNVEIPDGLFDLISDILSEQFFENRKSVKRGYVSEDLQKGEENDT